MLARQRVKEPCAAGCGARQPESKRPIPMINSNIITASDIKLPRKICTPLNN